jgi:hypothetical protein
MSTRKMWSIVRLTDDDKQKANEDVVDESTPGKSTDEQQQSKTDTNLQGNERG